MAQHGYGQMGGGGSIDPNDLAGSGSFNPGFGNNFGSAQNNHSTGFSSGSALISDDDLFDTLASPADAQSGMAAGHDFSGMSTMGLGGGGYSAQGIFPPQHGLPLDQNQMNGFSNTPDGDPIQSPFVHSVGQYRPMQHPQAFGSLQSPTGAFTGSPLAASDFTGADGSDAFLKSRSRLSQSMPRKAASATRSPMAAKTPSVVTAIPATSADSFVGSPQPIRTNGSSHEKSHSGQWAQTPNSLSSFPGSGFSSPMQPGGGLHSAQINELLLKGGTSMPAKLGAPMTTSQEAKRKRRRESHNLVERRRRDNINERIQDLSKLVPLHRLEDEKIKKLITSGTPLSPTLTGISNPSQATSGLAGPGARRAAGSTAGNITTGLPIEEKDKGPNKGDILNGAVSWCRDLMWLLDKYVSRQEELIEHFNDRGEPIPFSITDDERRMTSELMVAMRNPDGAEGEKKHFTYSRADGSGLRVPDYTDYKGDPLNGSGQADPFALSPGDGQVTIGHDLVDQGDFWGDDDGSGDMELKEEDEFMDLS